MRARLVASLMPPSQWEVDALCCYLMSKEKLAVITGAGISTASGIPDYRGPEGSYKLGHKPIVHQEFLSSDSARKRYWARSLAGFNLFNSAKPNEAHYSLANLETVGIVDTIVTQNVDRLHQKAGSKTVIDLHGRADKVDCVRCSYCTDRILVHDEILRLNPFLWAPSSAGSIRRESSDISSVDGGSGDATRSLRPDGDADVHLADYDTVQLPCCPDCGGILMPSVVFFGNSVKKEVVERIDRCDGLLIVGSSLEVFSAYRFVDRAAKKGTIPIAIVNAGVTRADRKDLPGIEFRSEAICSELLHSATAQILEYH